MPPDNATAPAGMAAGAAGNFTMLTLEELAAVVIGLLCFALLFAMLVGHAADAAREHRAARQEAARKPKDRG